MGVCRTTVPIHNDGSIKDKWNNFLDFSYFISIFFNNSASIYLSKLWRGSAGDSYVPAIEPLATNSSHKAHTNEFVLSQVSGNEFFLPTSLDDRVFCRTRRSRFLNHSPFELLLSCQLHRRLCFARGDCSDCFSQFFEIDLARSTHRLNNVDFTPT